MVSYLDKALVTLKHTRRTKQFAIQTATVSSAVSSDALEADFKTLFRDVKPLTDTNRYYPTPTFPQPRKCPPPRLSGPHTSRPIPAHTVGCFEPIDEDQQFVRAHLSTNTLRRLRNGFWPCQGELDLHGLDRYQALDTLVLFLYQSKKRANCVRVIHGKGYGSKQKPVLKRLVPSWLKHHPDVLAFCETSQQTGGSGALMVLLKRSTNKHVESH